MLESEGDRSLDAAEDAGRPGCFRATPVGLARGFAACFGSYWAFGAMQPTGQANAITARDRAYRRYWRVRAEKTCTARTFSTS